MKTKDLKYILETFANVIKIQPLRPITSFVECFCKDGVFRIGGEMCGIEWGFECWR